jgi:hypothetical protein
MKRSGRAWLLVPIFLVVAAVIIVVVSSYQEEVGLVEPSTWGRAAVGTLVEAWESCDGTTDEDYLVFSRALLVASAAYRHSPSVNPADTRLNRLAADALDCLYALREAWQAGMESAWDAATHGSVQYWNTLHPALELSGDGPLGPDEVRRLSRERAGELLEKAIDLAD